MASSSWRALPHDNDFMVGDMFYNPKVYTEICQAANNWNPKRDASNTGTIVGFGF